MSDTTLAQATAELDRRIQGLEMRESMLSEELSQARIDLEKLRSLRMSAEAMKEYFGGNAPLDAEAMPHVESAPKNRRRPRPTTARPTTQEDVVTDPIKDKVSSSTKVNLDPWAVKWLLEVVREGSTISSVEEMLDAAYPEGWRDLLINTVVGRGKTQSSTFEDDVSDEGGRLRRRLARTVDKIYQIRLDPNLMVGLTGRQKELMESLNNQKAWEQFESFVKLVGVTP